MNQKNTMKIDSKRRRNLGCGLLALGASTAALAQTVTPPDAGRSLQQLRSQPVQPTERKSQPGSLGDDRSTAAPARAEGSTSRMTVRKVSISGNRVLPTEELAALVSDLPGREWTLAQLRQAAERISAHYRAKGYLLARAYIPAQSFADGALNIAVLEGQLGKARIENGSRFESLRIQDFVNAQFPAGQPIQTEAANRGLLVLQSLPGVGSVEGSLRPGSEVGKTDLDVKLGRQPLVTGMAGVDSEGNRYTGRFRSSLQLNLNNLTTYGDQLSVQGVVGGEHIVDHLLSYGRASWDFPLGNDGFRWGAAYSKLNYKLGGSFEALNANGYARTSSFYASYPFLLAPTQQISSSAAFERRTMYDKQDAVGSDNRRDITAGVINIDGSFRDRAFGKPAVSGIHLQLTEGLLSLRTPSVEATDAVTRDSAGHYTKVLLSMNREQYLFEKLSLQIAYLVQRSTRNLDSSEQFFLGGPNRLRAYPTGEAPGDEGWFASAELRRPIMAHLQGVVFYEGGAVGISQNPYAPGSNALYRSGAGLGVNANWDHLLLTTSAAWRIGTKPTSDTSDSQPQLWFSGSWIF